MNSYKLNGMVGHVCRRAICEGLKIHHVEIYKTVKNITSDGIVETKDGKKYKLKLENIPSFQDEVDAELEKVYRYLNRKKNEKIIKNKDT
jgi:hypothetical protein